MWLVLTGIWYTASSFVLALGHLGGGEKELKASDLSFM